MIYVITNQGILRKSKTNSFILYKMNAPTSETSHINPGIIATIIMDRMNLKIFRNISQNLSIIDYDIE